MNREVNKFGVPYHSYTLTFKSGDEKVFDMAWEDDWGDINTCAFYDTNGEITEDSFLGYGNDEDGYEEIVKVVDDETGKKISLKKFGELVDSYVDCYSC